MARLTRRARDLRRNQTEAEERLWNELRARRLTDAKFLRQWQTGTFIADFACRSLRLAIELDGGNIRKANAALAAPASSKPRATA
jgi:very-short-patch-repair endonuclease